MVILGQGCSSPLTDDSTNSYCHLLTELSGLPGCKNPSGGNTPQTEIEYVCAVSLRNNMIILRQIVGDAQTCHHNVSRPSTVLLSYCLIRETWCLINNSRTA